VHDRISHAAMGDKHVEHRDLRQVGVEAAHRPGAQHGPAIIGHRPQHRFELTRFVR
jgi:hypothetical protein